MDDNNVYSRNRGFCGFGSFGATINGGDVSGASDLYRNGVRCTNSARCSKKPHRFHPDRKQAFGRMAVTTKAAASLFPLGIVDTEYRRVSCSYPNKNITIKIEENRNYLHIFSFYKQLCMQSIRQELWSSLDNNLVRRMLISNDDGGENWVLPHNNSVGQIYDSGVEVD
ncbi:hypothetical protein D8674_043087 [Pyrus ussuriensis x Pyrus communis]|uniref:Uncharacterized protein n=1 Tax=Pyrus ussuriensis x Pyrus communis TaxID=2448454 RepID=A0A5N5I6K9_9ROSA|nr:hypothetical protein D8674_043087 [Pyrus ussuriensis x Pyrus communis]